MGGIEIDKTTCFCTGRTFMVEIPNRSKDTFEQVINQHIKPGEEIWTDSHKSYNLLEKRGPWKSVVHARGEFSYIENGENIFTNAVEGLFHVRKNAPTAERH